MLIFMLNVLCLYSQYVTFFLFQQRSQRHRMHTAHPLRSGPTPALRRQPARLLCGGNCSCHIPTARTAAANAPRRPWTLPCGPQHRAHHLVHRTVPGMRSEHLDRIVFHIEQQLKPPRSDSFVFIPPLVASRPCTATRPETRADSAGSAPHSRRTSGTGTGHRRPAAVCHRRNHQIIRTHGGWSNVWMYGLVNGVQGLALQIVEQGSVACICVVCVVVCMFVGGAKG